MSACIEQTAQENVRTCRDILVVDDTIANLRYLTDILSKHDYVVRPVTDGKMAITSAQSNPPDNDFTRYLMPGLIRL
jgi:PleD family two-component response regulator